MSEVSDIPGWTKLVDWFGYSPNFHDSEVVSIDLRRQPEASKVSVHFWRTNNELTESGHFRQDRHALATFTINGIKSMNVEGWNRQNVLFELRVDRSDDSYVLHLEGIGGVAGEITASDISVEIEAFEPN